MSLKQTKKVNKIRRPKKKKKKTQVESKKKLKVNIISINHIILDINALLGKYFNNNFGELFIFIIK